MYQTDTPGYMTGGAFIVMLIAFVIIGLVVNQRQKDAARREQAEYESRKARREDALRRERIIQKQQAELRELKRKLDESEGR